MCQSWPEQHLHDDRLLFLYSLLHRRHNAVTSNIEVVYLIKPVVADLKGDKSIQQ